MSFGLKPDEEGAFNDESLEPYRQCLKWLLWAHRAAEDALQWPVADLALEVAGDPVYAQKTLDIYKMLLVERSAAAYREAVAEQMVDHVRAALLQGGVSLGEEIFATPIDYRRVPQFPGLEASEVNCLVVDLPGTTKTVDA